jgi:hypothetical protein
MSERLEVTPKGFGAKEGQNNKRKLVYEKPRYIQFKRRTPPLRILASLLCTVLVSFVALTAHAQTATVIDPQGDAINKKPLRAALVAVFTPVYPDVRVARPLTTAIGDIAFEVVGQVTNPSPTTSNQYGYLSLINGLSAEQIFTTPDPGGAERNHSALHILH